MAPIYPLKMPTTITHLKRLFQFTISFTQRQTHDFKLMLARRALHGVASGLFAQYSSIYATLLGADPVQIGSLQSAGNAVGALAAIPAGWFIDYYSLKKVFLLSTILLALSQLLYFTARGWAWLYPAIVLYYLGMRMTCTCCTVVCAAELPNQERGTGRGVCRTLSSVVAILTPLFAAWCISWFGGISLRGIRPLYATQILIFIGIFALLLTGLRGSRSNDALSDRRQMLSSFAQVFQHGPDAARLVMVMGLMELPWSLTQPFMPLYAHQIKGADEFALGAIYLAISIVPMVASIPLGRLADRYGRKKLLFSVAPLTCAANLCLVLAPARDGQGSLLLLLCGVLFGFNSISMALASSMTAEIMPKDQMGRWIGIVSLVRGLLAIPAPLIGGLIWDHVGPQYVFIAAIAIDALVRLPLLSSVQETLNLSPSPAHTWKAD
jgi:MFS family permease